MAKYIRRGLDPFKVIVRKLSWSFRCRVLQSDSILLKTIVNSMYIIRCKLSRKWNVAILISSDERVMSQQIDLFLLFCSFLLLLSCSFCVFMHVHIMPIMFYGMYFLK